MPEFLSSVANWPALLLAAYFGVGLCLYAARRERTTDAEMRERGHSVVLGAWLRDAFAWLMQPLLSAMIRLGIAPDAVSCLSVLIAIAAGIAAAFGEFTLAGALYLIAGLCDYFDGRLARVTGAASTRGAALDSILDRYSEAAVIIGLAWYYRQHWVLLVLLLFLAGSFLVPYIRAKGESLGLSMAVGLMQRPERVVILGIAMMLSALVDYFLSADLVQRFPHVLVIVVVVPLALSTQATAAYRLWHVTRRLTETSEADPFARMSRPAIVANALGTALDLALLVLAVARWHWPAWLASGVFAFTSTLLFFGWVRFRKAPEAISWQRAIVVAIGGGLANAGFVAMLLWIPRLDYRLAWLAARGAVGWAWNYPMARWNAQSMSVSTSDS